MVTLHGLNLFLAVQLADTGEEKWPVFFNMSHTVLRLLTIKSIATQSVTFPFKSSFVTFHKTMLFHFFKLRYNCSSFKGKRPVTS